MGRKGKLRISFVSPSLSLSPSLPARLSLYVQVSEKERGAAVVAEKRPALVPIKRSVLHCPGAHRLVCLLIMREGCSSNECGKVLSGQYVPSLLPTATGPHWTVWKQYGIKVQALCVVEGQHVACVRPVEPTYDGTEESVCAALMWLHCCWLKCSRFTWYAAVKERSCRSSKPKKKKKKHIFPLLVGCQVGILHHGGRFSRRTFPQHAVSSAHMPSVWRWWPALCFSGMNKHHEATGFV